MGTQNGFRIASPFFTNGSRRIERPQPITTYRIGTSSCHVDGRAGYRYDQVQEGIEGY
jgi:hypothetical protein